MKVIKGTSLFITLGGLFLFLTGCGTYDERLDRKPRMKLPSSELIAVSLYGERDITDYKVQFQGWETESQQAVFIVDRATKEKTYAYAYVLPEKLVREIWAEQIPELYHFTVQNGYINVDERTTALYLVFVSPPYFWLFTPRAVVYAAGYVIQHRDFELLVDKIAEVEPGTLLSEKSLEIFAIAQRIAEDVREMLLPARLTPRLDTQNQYDDCVLSRTGSVSGGGGTIKIKTRHMVFYGGGIMRGFDISDSNPPVKFFVLKAQNGKVDLSIGNIISFNIFNPEVETSVELPFPPGDDYGIRIEKGIELSTTIFTNPIKRIGLVANFGRTVKYAIEIAVPNIAACIPDGDTWGWVVATAQNIINEQDTITLKSVFDSGAWDEILRLIVQMFPGNFITNLLSKLGFSGCGNGVNFIVNQIAATIRWFPLVKLWDAFTKYIPFGIELFTKPKSGAYFARNGSPFGHEIPVVTSFPQRASSPGIFKVSVLPYGCRWRNCTIRINCGADLGVYEKSFSPTPEGACNVDVSLPLGVGFYGQNCILSLIYSNDTEVFRKTITIENCPTCKPPAVGGAGGGQEEGGGCQSTSPISIYHIFAIFVLILMRNFKSRRNEN